MVGTSWPYARSPGGTGDSDELCTGLDSSGACRLGRQARWGARTRQGVMEAVRVALPTAWVLGGAEEGPLDEATRPLLAFSFLFFKEKKEIVCVCVCVCVCGDIVT